MTQVGQYPQAKRDERISLSSQASNLPSPLKPVSVHRQKFAAKGLNDHDLVTLLGMLSFTASNL
jgi:peroxidase